MIPAQRPSRWENPPWSHALVVLPFLVGLVLIAGEVRRDRAIAARERTTHGTIVSNDPGNHNSYEYAYTVGGRTYRAWQIPYRIQWRIGEQVVVYYDSANPAVSSLTTFAERSDFEARPIPALLIGIVLVLGYIAWRRYRAWRVASRS